MDDFLGSSITILFGSTSCLQESLFSVLKKQSSLDLFGSVDFGNSLKSESSTR